MIKNLLLTVLAISTCFNLFSQDEEKIKAFFEKGVRLHDAGKYKEAIQSYNKILEIDKNNIVAYAEIAMSYTAMEDYKTAIKFCRKAIKAKPNSRRLANVYVQLGTCYDLLGNGKRAIKSYDKGLELFPNFYMLHFNKGVTQINLKDYEGSIKSFQQSMRLKPTHPSSHYYLGMIEIELNHKIPAILALSRFLVLENNTKRSAYAGQYIRRLLGSYATENEDGSISINLSGDFMEEKKGNSFSMIDMQLSLSAALQVTANKTLEDSLGVKMTKAEKFLTFYDLLCDNLDESKKEEGFYWKYYVPYFLDMKAQEHTRVMAHLVHLHMKDNTYVNEWFEENEAAIDNFSKWTSAFEW